MRWTKEIAAKIAIQACSYIFTQKIVVPKDAAAATRPWWLTGWLTCPQLPGQEVAKKQKTFCRGSELTRPNQATSQPAAATTEDQSLRIRRHYKVQAADKPAADMEQHSTAQCEIQRIRVGATSNQHHQPANLLFIDMDQILFGHHPSQSQEQEEQKRSSRIGGGGGIPLCVHLNMCRIIMV